MIKTIIIVPFLIVACVSIPYSPKVREVKRVPTLGGALLLPEDYRNEDRARADIVMKSNCGNREVRVVSEGATGGSWALDYQCIDSEPSSSPVVTR